MAFSDYHKYIEGKNVIFVGACPNIKGKDWGQWVDSFDVVIRTNGSINLINGEEFVKDYGRKTDVLYTNNQFYRETKPLPIDEFKLKGVEWLCMKNCRLEDYNIYRKDINTRVITDVAKGVAKQSKSPHMGSIIYTDLLSFNPKELFLTGVDFFASKNAEFQHDIYKEYVDGYLPDNIRKQGNRINKGKKEDGHNFKGNAEYINSLFMQNDNFKTHDFIRELLQGIVNGSITQPC